MFTTLLFATAVIYFGVMVFCALGMRRSERLPTGDGSEPPVSVIVAARNEEHYIRECVESLLRLDYPPGKLQIIVVNDSSTDRTAEILAGFLPHPLLHVTETKPGDGPLRGKTNAVATGMRVARGDIILLTDADCIVPRQWVRETVRCMTPETGIVGGFTVLRAHTLFERIQSLDWIFLFGIASGGAGWGMPLTVVGNNFAIRRAAYDETGGYEAIPFSVTEDYALVRSVLHRAKYKIRFPLNPGTLVESHPCSSFLHLFRQKQRWGVGGLDMALRGMLIMAAGWVARLFVVCSAAAFAPAMTSAAAAILLAGDLLFLMRPLQRFSRLSLLRSFLPFEIFLTIYVLLLPFVSIASKKVIWKERRL